MSKLEKIADDVWVVAHDLFTFGVHFPGRMTVVRLSGGGLWLYSPVPIDDGLAEALAELGPVEHLVGPNAYHHVHLTDVQKRYPDAKLWLAPPLEKKRADLRAHAILGDDAPEPWQGELRQFNLRFAPRLGEVAFFHEKSATLIVADLFMNVHECKGLLSRFVFWLEGGYRKMGAPRLFRLLTSDRAFASKITAEIIDQQASTVIMCHGRIVHEQAGNQVQKALAPWSPRRELPSNASA